LDRTTKKLKHKIEYLRLELEEATEINSKCLEKFNQDFAGDFPEDDEVKDKLRGKESEEPFESIPKEITNKLFKEIAVKTHPDKMVQDTEELFIKANKANKSNDLSTLLLERHSNELARKIQDIRNQMAWVWYHVDDIRRPLVRKRIQQMLELDKEK
jgi:hypothetical protein